MSTCMLGWINYIKTGSLSAGSIQAGLDIGNLQTDQGSASVAWQTVSGVITSAAGAWLAIDAGASVTWRAFLLARANLTSAATVRWRVGNDATFATTNYDSGTLSGGVVPGFAQSLIVAPSDQVGRYCRCDIDDAANPDGFINIALGFGGPVWQPGVNIDYGSTFGRDAQVDEVTSRGGQEYPLLRWQRRRYELSLQAVKLAEVWPNVMALDAAARAGGNVLFVPDPAGAYVAQETIFGRLSSQADVSYPYQAADARAWKARITERL